jgi:hypothetical protein
MAVSLADPTLRVTSRNISIETSNRMPGLHILQKGAVALI